jgi:hypothetical protein
MNTEHWTGALLLALCTSCSDDVTPASIDCRCGLPLDAASNPDLARSFDDALADWTQTGCDWLIAVRGTCADGKVFLYRDGGFGHDARYFAGGQVIGASWSSDVSTVGCPWTHYEGPLAALACEIVNVEPLCPSGPPTGGGLTLDELSLPFADGTLTPWCDPA